MPRPEDRPIKATNHLVRQIFEHARRKGMSFEYLFETTGMSHSQLSGYRTGKNAPSADRLLKLAKAVGLRLIVIDVAEDDDQ